MPNITHLFFIRAQRERENIQWRGGGGVKRGIDRKREGKYRWGLYLVYFFYDRKDYLDYS